MLGLLVISEINSTCNSLVYDVVSVVTVTLFFGYYSANEFSKNIYLRYKMVVSLAL